MISRQSTQEGANSTRLPSPAVSHAHRMVISSGCGTSSALPLSSSSCLPSARPLFERKESVRYNKRNVEGQGAANKKDTVATEACTIGSGGSLSTEQRKAKRPPRKPHHHYRNFMMDDRLASPLKQNRTKATMLAPPAVVVRGKNASHSNKGAAHAAVRFAPDSEILYIPVPALTNLTPTDVAAQWWSPTEFYDHRMAYKAVVQEMEQLEEMQLQSSISSKLQSSPSTSSPYFDTISCLWTSIEGSRGLEQRTEDGAWKYYTTKRTTAEAVLDEQKALSSSRHVSSSSIAAVYAKHAATAVHEALERARFDAHQVGIAVDFKSLASIEAAIDVAIAEESKSNKGCNLPPRPITCATPLATPKKKTTKFAGECTPPLSASRPPLTTSAAGATRHRDLPPYLTTPKTPNPRGSSNAGGDAALNNQSLNDSLHSVTSRVLSSRPRLVREMAASQRHLLESPCTTLMTSPHTIGVCPSPMKASCLAAPLDGSMHSAKSSSTRPKLRREYLISSKRDVLGLDSSAHRATTTIAAASTGAGAATPTGVPTEYSLDAASVVVQNTSNRSLMSISSQVSSSSTRPKLRRETAASKRSLLDPPPVLVDKKSERTPMPFIIYTAGSGSAGNDNGDDDDNEDELDDGNDQDTEITPLGSSQRSPNSISSQVSSSSSRPRLKREQAASGKSLLSNKSSKSQKAHTAVAVAPPPHGPAAMLKTKLPRPPPSKQPTNAKEIVFSPEETTAQQPIPSTSTSSKQSLTRKSSHKKDKKKQLQIQMEESVDSFANSLESPLSTSASSSTSSRPGLRRQPSMVLKRNAAIPAKVATNAKNATSPSMDKFQPECGSSSCICR